MKKALLLFLFLVVSIYPQKKDYSNEPGYVDFTKIANSFNEKMTKEVLIEENLLKMMMNFTNEDEPNMADLLSGIKLINIKGYEVDNNNTTEIESFISEIEKNLESEDWERIVMVKEKDEKVNVYVKSDNKETVYGVVITTMESEKDSNGNYLNEAVFVNIVGNINMKNLANISRKFDFKYMNK